MMGCQTVSTFPNLETTREWIAEYFRKRQIPLTEDATLAAIKAPQSKGVRRERELADDEPSYWTVPLRISTKDGAISLMMRISLSHRIAS